MLARWGTVRPTTVVVVQRHLPVQHSPSNYDDRPVILPPQKKEEQNKNGGGEWCRTERWAPAPSPSGKKTKTKIGQLTEKKHWPVTDLNRRPAYHPVVSQLFQPSCEEGASVLGGTMRAGGRACKCLDAANRALITSKWRPVPGPT